MTRAGGRSSSVDRPTIQSTAKTREKYERRTCKVGTNIFASVGSSSSGLSRDLHDANGSSPSSSISSLSTSPLPFELTPKSPGGHLALNLSEIPFDIAEYPKDIINNIIDFLREFQPSKKAPSEQDANDLVIMINSLITEFKNFIKPAQSLRSRCSSRSSSPSPLSELSTSSTKLGDVELRIIVDCLLSTKEFVEKDYKVLCKNNLIDYFQTLLDFGQIDRVNHANGEDDLINKLTELSNSLSDKSSSSSDKSYNSVTVGALTVGNSGIIDELVPTGVDEPGDPGVDELGWLGVDERGAPGVNELGWRGVKRSESPGVDVLQSPSVREATLAIERKVIEELNREIDTLKDQCNKYAGKIRALEFNLDQAIKDKKEAEKLEVKRLCDDSFIEEIEEAVNKKKDEIKGKIKEGYIRELISLKEQLKAIQNDLSLASSGIIEYQELFAPLMQATEELTKEHKIVNQRLMEALADQAAAEESKKELEVAKAAALAAQAEAEGRAGVAEQEREAAEKRATAAEEAQEKSEAERDQAREAQKQALAELAEAKKAIEAQAELETAKKKAESDKAAANEELQKVQVQLEEDRAANAVAEEERVRETKEAQAAAEKAQQQVAALEAAHKAAEAKATAAQQQAREANKDKEAGLAAAQAELETAKKKAESDKAEAEAKVEALEAAQAEAQQQFQQQLAAAEVRATAVEQQARASNKAKAEAEKANAELIRVKAELEKAREENKDKEAGLAAAQVELETAKKKAESDNAAAEAKVAALEAAHKAAERRATEAEAELEKAMLELVNVKLFLAENEKLLQKNLNAAMAAETAMQAAEEEIKVCYGKLARDIEMFETLLYNKEGVEKIISELEVKLHESININKKLSGDIRIEEARLLILQLELEKLNIQISTAKEELDATQKEAEAKVAALEAARYEAEAKAKAAVEAQLGEVQAAAVAANEEEKAALQHNLAEVQQKANAAQAELKQTLEAAEAKVAAELEAARKALAEAEAAQEAEGRASEELGDDNTTFTYNCISPLNSINSSSNDTELVEALELKSEELEEYRDVEEVMASQDTEQLQAREVEVAQAEADERYRVELAEARAAEAAAEEQAMTQLAEVEKMRAELEATRTQAEIAKAKAAAVVEAKKAAEVRANAAQAAAEVDREKYLARREDQTKAAGSNVSRVNDARNIWSNDYGRTYWRDYNPRLDKSSKDYWKDYVTREIEDNQTAINDSKLIKNTVVPAAAIGSVGVFIAAAATNFLPIMLSIAAMLLAIATFVFKDCKDEIDYRKDSIKELRGQKVGGFTDAILSESKTSLNHPIR